MTGIIGLVFWSTLGLAPVVGALFIASRLRRSDRLVALAPSAALIGFFVGAAVGWTLLLPPQWTASFWTTVEAAGNAAKYGHEFEHTAERALMYVLYPGVLTGLALGLAALLITWRIPAAPSATPAR